MEERIKELEQQVRQMESDNQSLRERNESLENKLSEMLVENERLKENNQFLEATSTQLSKDIDGLRKELEIKTSSSKFNYDNYRSEKSERERLELYIMSLKANISSFQFPK